MLWQNNPEIVWAAHDRRITTMRGGGDRLMRLARAGREAVGTESRITRETHGY